MGARKTATLTVRVDPAVKDGLRRAAELEHRSIANMVEVLVRAHCARAGVEIPAQSETFSPSDEAAGVKGA